MEKQMNVIQNKQNRPRATRRVTSFRDLGRIRSRIEKLDGVLRAYSLPQLRSILHDLEFEKAVKQGIAKYRAVLIRNLRNGVSPDDNFFLRTNKWQDFVMLKLEGEITNGFEIEWQGDWKRTLWDILTTERQAELLNDLQTQLISENNLIRYYGYVIEYIKSFIEGRGVDITAFDELSGAGTQAALAIISKTFTNWSIIIQSGGIPN